MYTGPTWRPYLCPLSYCHFDPFSLVGYFHFSFLAHRAIVLPHSPSTPARTPFLKSPFSIAVQSTGADSAQFRLHFIHLRQYVPMSYPLSFSHTVFRPPGSHAAIFPFLRRGNPPLWTIVLQFSSRLLFPNYSKLSFPTNGVRFLYAKDS